jgi:hypothetical protein
LTHARAVLRFCHRRRNSSGATRRSAGCSALLLFIGNQDYKRFGV